MQFIQFDLIIISENKQNYCSFKSIVSNQMFLAFMHLLYKIYLYDITVGIGAIFTLFLSQSFLFDSYL